MPKTVNILGLYRAELKLLGINQVKDFEGEIWSLTDWYRSYPWLDKVDRLYLLHSLKSSIEYAKDTEKHDRYPGDWKSKFESCREVVVYDEEWMDYLDTNVRKLEYERLKDLYHLDFCCTVDIMIAEALSAGFEKINLFGVFMVGTEHSMYIGGVLRAIDLARMLGVEIYSQYENKWRQLPTITCKPYLEICD